MKNYSVRLLIVGLIFFAACSKDGESTVSTPPVGLDLLTRLSNSWELYMYNISTDKGKYYFTGADIKEHSLRLLTFSKNGSFTSADTDWTGTFELVNDSTQIVLTPAASFVTCVLNLDNISPHQMQFSSPWVQVNPEKTGASDYEKFIAYQGLNFLSVKRIDISALKSIKIEFRYSAR